MNATEKRIVELRFLSIILSQQRVNPLRPELYYNKNSERLTKQMELEKRNNELQMLSTIILRKKINTLTPRLYYWYGIGQPKTMTK
jgi:hypothetical protein